MKIGEIWASKSNHIKVRITDINEEDGEKWIYIEPHSTDSLGMMDPYRTIEEMNKFFYKVYDESR